MPPARFAPRSWGPPAPCSRGCLYGVPAGGAEPGGQRVTPPAAWGLQGGDVPTVFATLGHPVGDRRAQSEPERPPAQAKGVAEGGGETQHGPRADEMLCQGSSSAGGHGEGQPAQGAGPPPNAALGPAARSPGGARPLPGAASQHGAPKCPPLPSLGLAGGRGPAGGSAHPYPQGATSWVPGCRAGASVRLSKHSGMRCPADDMRVSLCLTTRTREIFFFFSFFSCFFFFLNSNTDSQALPRLRHPQPLDTAKRWKCPAPCEP